MKYDLIVVDPPWPIKKITHKARPTQTEMDYPLMSLPEIKALPIGSIAADNSFCFLWTTQKHLFHSKEILEGWGFRFLMTMVWEKTYGKSAGMPLFGFRWNGEFILIGYKGKIDLWPKRPLIPAVFSAPNIRHSEKPDRFYEMIAPLGVSRADIFARKTPNVPSIAGFTCNGWDIWGNELPNDVEL